MPRDDHLRRLRARLGLGDFLDASFDADLAPLARAKSRRFWTPISAARTAALRFRERGVRRVLDVGSGPGKFCIVAACAQPEVRFYGIEQRAELASGAVHLGRHLQLANLELSLGDALETPWHAFDGLYFFNPFAENSYLPEDAFDTTVDLSQARLAGELPRALTLLSRVPAGTVVITYHGLSGPIPSTYDLVSAEPIGPTWLRTWVKSTRCDEPWCHLEQGDQVSRVTPHPPYRRLHC